MSVRRDKVRWEEVRCRAAHRRSITAPAGPSPTLPPLRSDESPSSIGVDVVTANGFAVTECSSSASFAFSPNFLAESSPSARE